MKIHKGLTQIADYFEEIKARLTVKYADTLFPPDWGALKQHRCVLCGCKIYRMRSKPLWYCKSTKHKKFVIQEHVMNTIITNEKNTIKKKNTPQSQQAPV